MAKLPGIAQRAFGPFRDTVTKLDPDLVFKARRAVMGARQIARCGVEWPGGGVRTTFESVPATWFLVEATQVMSTWGGTKIAKEAIWQIVDTRVCDAEGAAVWAKELHLPLSFTETKKTTYPRYERPLSVSPGWPELEAFMLNPDLPAGELRQYASYVPELAVRNPAFWMAKMLDPAWGEKVEFEAAEAHLLHDPWIGPKVDSVSRENPCT